MSTSATEILIVGGGPAGMAAALAASQGGGSVTVVDDNPYLGGQIWRAELGRTRSPEAAKLIKAVGAGRVRILGRTQVFAPVSDGALAAESPAGRVEILFDKLIIATGARELFLPFPGWTLPGVMGAGGLQALVKGGLKIENKRIIIAGTGPLLLAVAENLKAKGATIVAIVEQAPPARLNRLALGLWRSPAKLFQAALLRARLLGVPYLTNTWVSAAESAESRGPAAGTSEMRVMLSSGRHLSCDYLACGFHLVPNSELARVVGCETSGGLVHVDEFQRTSVPIIYCAGEPTGIGGLEASLTEGTIAGHAAAGDEERAKVLFPKRAKTRRFGESLNDAFELRPELKRLADAATIVCRCEDVKYGSLKEFPNWRTAKLQTRCGMGPCQGRVCGAAAEALFGWTVDPPRPPIFPVKMENL